MLVAAALMSIPLHMELLIVLPSINVLKLYQPKIPFAPLLFILQFVMVLFVPSTKYIAARLAPSKAILFMVTLLLLNKLIKVSTVLTLTVYEAGSAAPKYMLIILVEGLKYHSPNLSSVFISL